MRSKISIVMVIPPYASTASDTDPPKTKKTTIVIVDPVLVIVKLFFAVVSVISDASTIGTVLIVPVDDEIIKLCPHLAVVPANVYTSPLKLLPMVNSLLEFAAKVDEKCLTDPIAVESVSRSLCRAVDSHAVAALVDTLTRRLYHLPPVVV